VDILEKLHAVEGTQAVEEHIRMAEEDIRAAEGDILAAEVDILAAEEDILAVELGTQAGVDIRDRDAGGDIQGVAEEGIRDIPVAEDSKAGEDILVLIPLVFQMLQAGQSH